MKSCYQLLQVVIFSSLLVSTAFGQFWATGGNQVSNAHVLGSINNERLKLITASSTRLEVASTGEIAINTTTLPDVMLNIQARTGVGVALRARTFATSGTVYPYCIQAVVNTDATKAFSVWNEALTGNGCNQGTGEEVFRVWGDGRIEAKRVKIFVDGWCDYVFDDNYPLPPLEEVNTYIQTNGHLPEIPALAEVLQDGVDVGEMEALLLKKIEELTLYAIAQQQRCDDLERQLVDLKTKLEAR